MAKMAKIKSVLELQVYLSQVLPLFKMLFIDGSPSIDGFIDSTYKIMLESPVNNKGKFQRNRWSTCNRYTFRFQDWKWQTLQYAVSHEDTEWTYKPI